MTHPNPVQVLRELIRDLHPINTALIDTASRLAYIRDLLPPKGELPEEFRELVITLTWLETAYHDANQKLLDAYTLLEHHQRVPNPKPLEAA